MPGVGVLGSLREQEINKHSLAAIRHHESHMAYLSFKFSSQLVSPAHWADETDLKEEEVPQDTDIASLTFKSYEDEDGDIRLYSLEMESCLKEKVFELMPRDMTAREEQYTAAVALLPGERLVAARGDTDRYYLKKVSFVVYEAI